MNEHSNNFVEVRIITTAGIYPDAGFEHVPENQPIKVIIKKADDKLHITNTDGWIAVVAGRKIDIDKSYGDNGLSARVEIDWGPDHGAGGYA